MNGTGPMRRRTSSGRRMNPVLRGRRPAAASGARDATAVKLSNFGYQYSTPALFGNGSTPPEADQNWREVWNDFEKRQLDIHSLIHCMAPNGGNFPPTKVCEIMSYYKVLYAVMKELRKQERQVASVGAAEFKTRATTNRAQNLFFVQENFVHLIAESNGAANRLLREKLLSLYRFVRLLHTECQLLTGSLDDEVERFKGLTLSPQSLRSTNDDGRLHRNLLIASQLFFQYLTFYQFAFDSSFETPWFDQSQTQRTVKLLPQQTLSSFMKFSGLAMKGMHTLDIDTWRTHLVLMNESSDYQNTQHDRTIPVIRNVTFDPNSNQFNCSSTSTEQQIVTVELPHTYSFPLHYLSTSMFLIVQNSQNGTRNDRVLPYYAVPPSDDSTDRSNRHAKLQAWMNRISQGSMTPSRSNHNIQLLALAESK